jgi:hypothetical protein
LLQGGQVTREYCLHFENASYFGLFLVPPPVVSKK